MLSSEQPEDGLRGDARARCTAEVAITASLERGPETSGVPRIARCCPHHPDWPTLAQHLSAAYPEAAITDVVLALSAARDAVEDKGLDDADRLDLAELIARQQLLMLTGRTPDAARLDPERHQRSTINQ